MDIGGCLTTRGRSHQKWVSLPQKRKAVLMGLEALDLDPSDYGILCLDPHEGVKALPTEEKSGITMSMPSSVSSGSENGSPDPVGGGKAPAFATRRQGDKAVLMAETPDVTLLLSMSGSSLNGPVPVRGSSVDRPVPIKGYLRISAAVAHSVGERLVKHGLDGQVSQSTYQCSSYSGPERPFCVDRPVYHGQSRDHMLLGLVLPPIQADLVYEACIAHARSVPGASILSVLVACVQKLEFLSLA